jgi:hypothetical protein
VTVPVHSLSWCSWLAVSHVVTMHMGAHGPAAGIVVTFDWCKHEVHCNGSSAIESETHDFNLFQTDQRLLTYHTFFVSCLPHVSLFSSPHPLTLAVLCPSSILSTFTKQSLICISLPLKDDSPIKLRTAMLLTLHILFFINHHFFYYPFNTTCTSTLSQLNIVPTSLVGMDRLLSCSLSWAQVCPIFHPLF